VAAGKTADAVIVEFFVEGGIRLANSLIEDVAEGGHGRLWQYFSAVPGLKPVPKRKAHRSA
jgi:hypothetical protein